MNNISNIRNRSLCGCSLQLGDTVCNSCDVCEYGSVGDEREGNNNSSGSSAYNEFVKRNSFQYDCSNLDLNDHDGTVVNGEESNNNNNNNGGSNGKDESSSSIIRNDIIGDDKKCQIMGGFMELYALSEQHLQKGKTTTMTVGQSLCNTFLRQQQHTAALSQQYICACDDPVGDGGGEEENSAAAKYSITCVSKEDGCVDRSCVHQFVEMTIREERRGGDEEDEDAGDKWGMLMIASIDSLFQFETKTGGTTPDTTTYKSGSNLDIKYEYYHCAFVVVAIEPRG